MVFALETLYRWPFSGAENEHLYSVFEAKNLHLVSALLMVSHKHYVFKNMHFLKMLQKRYTGGRFSTLKPLQNKLLFVTRSFSEEILMILKLKKTTFRKVIFSQCRNGKCAELFNRVRRVIQEVRRVIQETLQKPL